mgnify:CR=1 FL=1
MILITEVTKKIKSRTISKRNLEKEQQEQQAENFQSTVNHELRTPIASILFFIRQIQQFVKTLIEMDIPGEDGASRLKFSRDVASAEKYLNLATSQLLLMQTFINDLLDVKQLKEGVFNLVNEVFNPNETFQLAVSIFE